MKHFYSLTVKHFFSSSNTFHSNIYFMRKFYVTAILILLSWVGVNGQSTANYTFATNATGSLSVDRSANVVNMTAGTSTLVAADVDDNAPAAVNIGFDFFLYGIRFTQFSTLQMVWSH